MRHYSIVTRVGDDVFLGHSSVAYLSDVKMAAECLCLYNGNSNPVAAMKTVANLVMSTPSYEVRTPNCDGPLEKAKKPYERAFEKAGWATGGGQRSGKAGFESDEHNVAVKVSNGKFRVFYTGSGHVMARGITTKELTSTVRYLNALRKVARLSVVQAACGSEWGHVENIEALSRAVAGDLERFCQFNKKRPDGIILVDDILTQFVAHDLDYWLRCGGLPRDGQVDGHDYDVMQPDYSNVVADISSATTAIELFREMSRHKRVWEDVLGIVFNEGKVSMTLRMRPNPEYSFVTISFMEEVGNSICDEMTQSAEPGRLGLCNYYKVPGRHGYGDISKVAVQDRRAENFFIIRPMFGF